MNSVLDIEAIRDVLRKRRDDKGLNNRSLSLAADLNETAVRDLLNKVEDPRIGTLLRLAEALDCSPYELLGGNVPLSGLIRGDGEIELPESPTDIFVARPSEANGGELWAFGVKDDGLYPCYDAGDVVYASRGREIPMTACLGKECIVQLAGTGAMLLKRVERGESPSTFRLYWPGVRNDLLGTRLAFAAPVKFVARGRLRDKVSVPAVG